MVFGGSQMNLVFHNPALLRDALIGLAVGLPLASGMAVRRRDWRGAFTLALTVVLSMVVFLGLLALLSRLA